MGEWQSLKKTHSTEKITLKFGVTHIINKNFITAVKIIFQRKLNKIFKIAINKHCYDQYSTLVRAILVKISVVFFTRRCTFVSVLMCFILKQYHIIMYEIQN